MSKKRKSTPKSRHRLQHEAQASASGALVGAVVGAVAGPPGAVAGAVLGGIAGAITGALVEENAALATARTRTLDAQIGVSGGDLGTDAVEHPPAKIGAYSMGSAGAGASSDEAPAEGPMQSPGS
jgi:hypothetical protein